MEPRDRILSAAASLFAKRGFRGATTKQIAQQARVNEVTIFRTFGSKQRLITEAIHSRAKKRLATLPASPGNPATEIAEWCEAQLAFLRESRSLIRACMGELEERPDFAPDAVHGSSAASEELGKYLRALRAQGRLPRGVNHHAAVAMLLGACFADAMGRDIMPLLFPQPPEDAAAEYTNLFLRALTVSGATAPVVAKPKRKLNLRRSIR